MMRNLALAARLACAAAVAVPGAAGAQTAASPTEETVVVTGSVTQRRIDEAPYAISAIGRDTLRASGAMINLSEALVRVPGLVVNNRSNFAQDLQIGSRGFGARATFGVRGVRLYADGIPASGPDGQGQVSHFDIAGAQRVEVLRGPFSALYGNASGGVISIFSAPVTRREWEVAGDVGSFGLRQGRATLATPLPGGFDLRASLSAATTDGFRPQSAADKRQAAARLRWQGERDSLVLTVNHLDQPALDPLGLTQAQFALGPRQTAQVAIDFNTRKEQTQSQLGLHWRHAFDAGALREFTLAGYGGTRAITQWLAIPAGTQGNPRHGGGVVDFDRRYEGVEARLRWAWPGLDLSAGVAVDRQHDDRRGYENFTGSGAGQVLGTIGRLRRDEVNRAETRDAFAQADWALAPTLVLSAGVRGGRVELKSRDAYLGNGDDSGAVGHDYLNPVAGVRWQVTPQWQLHASVARGFESPTLGELAYRADGTGGFNTALEPQTSRQAEVGLRWRQGGLRLDATAFEVRTSDEIGVATNAGGRSAFQNVGRTERRGVELALQAALSSAWQLQLAASTLSATYRDGFLACAGIPCSAPTVPVPAGNRIAGAPRSTAFAELAWHGGAFGTWGLEWRAVGSMSANDRNSADAAVPGYAVGALRWSKAYPLGPAGARWEWLLRVDNVTDRHHAASVIVNDANGRFFEPGAPRSVLLALRVVGGF